MATEFELLAPTPSAPKIPSSGLVIHPGALVAAETLIEKASLVGEVNSNADLDLCIQVQGEIAGLVKMAEDARVTLKAPYLEAGRAIDTAAKGFISRLDAAKKQLSVMAGEYASRVRKEQEEARRKADQEARLLAAEMEAKRIAAISQMGRGDKDKETIRAEVEAIEAEAAAELAQINQAKAAVVQQAPQGMTVRRSLNYRVTDIQALYRAKPDLCIITENKAAIKAVLKHTRDIPGLEVWEETSASARATTVKLDEYDY